MVTAAKAMSKPLSLVFGLSADPVHIGHEKALSTAISYLQAQQRLSEVIIVPVYAPNLIAGKQGPQARYTQRLWMCQLLARQLRKQHGAEITVSRIEERNYLLDHRLSYTYDTLHSLKKTRLGLLVNADHFCGPKPKFEQWYRWQDIVSEFELLICQRPGYEINSDFISHLQDNKDGRIHVLPDTMPDVSSTLIRKTFKENPQDLVLKSLLNKKIHQYILKNRIYHRLFHIH